MLLLLPLLALLIMLFSMKAAAAAAAAGVMFEEVFVDRVMLACCDDLLALQPLCGRRLRRGYYATDSSFASVIYADWLSLCLNRLP